MRHAVIMAGGSGTRLWPLSRRMRPKQLMKLFAGESLLHASRRRLESLFSPENIWVITSADYIDLVARELPDIPRENLIGEPTGRDTANAIGLAAHLLALRDPEATMAVFTADHLISPMDEFSRSIRTGLDVAEQHASSLITFGITPARPHTGYGYIHRGEAVRDRVYRVVEFKEKPDLETAERYVASGEYYWNSGMFAWRCSAILAEMARCLPDSDTILSELAQRWRKDTGSPAIAERFEQLEKISIDFGVMEKARDVLTVEMNCRWLDLGSWSAIALTGDPDEKKNVAVAENALVVDGANNILVAESEHLIVALGVDDLVVIHSDDATLVCHREFEQQIKQLAELRREHFGERFE